MRYYLGGNLFAGLFGTARWCRWQWHSLEMKAVRSSGRGMGFHIEKNDVPALSAGARNSAV